MRWVIRFFLAQVASPGGGRLVRRFAYQVALALVWASLWESFELWHLIGGFLVASLLLDGLSRLLDNKSNQV